MGKVTMSSTLDIKDWAYSKAATVEKSGKLCDFVEDYAQLVTHEGGETGICGAIIINMDECAKCVKANECPSSMDFVMAVEPRDTTIGQRQFVLIDCKFNIVKSGNVKRNISNTQIKAKFYASKRQIDSYCALPCCNTAIFLFKDKNFEQVRNGWEGRRLPDPRHKAIKISDFETLFTL